MGNLEIRPSVADIRSRPFLSDIGIRVEEIDLAAYLLATSPLDPSGEKK
jgi:hypothetical protein